MSQLTLLGRQLSYENRSFWRNPAAAFFTFFFPLMFLFLFPVIFGDGELHRYDVTFSVVNFYVPAIAVFALVSASFTNLAMTLTFAREAGVLKRKLGTPLSPGVYIASRILHATFVGLLLVAIVIVVGMLFHDVDPPHSAVAFAVTVAVGTATFSALGIALTGFIPSEDAAPAIVNAAVLPLLFISDVFIPLTESTPSWLTDIARLFPIYHFSQAMISSYLDLDLDAFEWSALAIVGAWGLLGALVALKKFRWEPKR